MNKKNAHAKHENDTVKNQMLAAHLDDGSFSGDRSLVQIELDGYREDPSVFEEIDTLNAGLRDQMDAFYDRIDFDLACEESRPNVW